MNKVFFVIIIGIIIGVLWFHFGERSDKSKMDFKCWEKLHYLNKERSPLVIVHLKSILAGIILIILANTKFQYRHEIITIIGAAIIGLHISQYINESNYITAFFKKMFIFHENDQKTHVITKSY